MGIAAAEAHLAARFNKPDMEPVIDHYTYVVFYARMHACRPFLRRPPRSLE